MTNLCPLEIEIRFFLANGVILFCCSRGYSKAGDATISTSTPPDTMALISGRSSKAKARISCQWYRRLPKLAHPPLDVFFLFFSFWTRRQTTSLRSTPAEKRSVPSLETTTERISAPCALMDCFIVPSSESQNIRLPSESPEIIVLFLSVRC